MRLPHKTVERTLFQKGYRTVIAVDEVGMGCLAGPVVVCAIAVEKAFYKRAARRLARLRDSKLLNQRQREVFAAKLLSLPGLRRQIAFSYPKTIDRFNIYQAARRAMRRAVTRLAVQPYSHKIVLVDGPHKIANLNIPQIPVVKGDRRVFAIAAASILAKVYRDRMMVRYAKRFPPYGFEKHKGYGTKLHRAMLARYGPSKIHRRSFAPVARLV